MKYNSIKKKFADYIFDICTALNDKRVKRTELTTYVLRLLDLKFESEDAIELRLAKTTSDIIHILCGKHASFLDCGIFEAIIGRFELLKMMKWTELSKYSEHLKAYIEGLKISEFIEINPKLGERKSVSKEEVALKLDIELIGYSVAKLFEVKLFIANILGIAASDLKLLFVKEGCVAATFLTSLSVAHAIFASDKALSAQQAKQLRNASVLQLRCGEFFMDLR